MSESNDLLAIIARELGRNHFDPVVFDLNWVWALPQVAGELKDPIGNDHRKGWSLLGVAASDAFAPNLTRSFKNVYPEFYSGSLGLLVEGAPALLLNQPKFQNRCRACLEQNLCVGPDVPR